MQLQLIATEALSISVWPESPGLNQKAIDSLIKILENPHHYSLLRAIAIQSLMAIVLQSPQEFSLKAFNEIVKEAYFPCTHSGKIDVSDCAISAICTIAKNLPMMREVAIKKLFFKSRRTNHHRSS